MQFPFTTETVARSATSQTRMELSVIRYKSPAVFIERALPRQRSQLEPASHPHRNRFSLVPFIHMVGKTNLVYDTHIINKGN